MDAVAYSYADKQAKRIEKFIENPDSTSGIVTTPKVIEAGETVTIPAGRMAVLPNLQIDGDLVIDGDVFVPSGATFGNLESQIDLKAPLDSAALVNPTINGIAQSGYSGFKNYIINGGFDVWQRGTTFISSPNEAYHSDGWAGGFAGASCNVYKGGAVFSSGEHTLAIDGVAGNTVAVLKQRIESVNCRNFKQGRTFTLSCEIYSNSNTATKAVDFIVSRPVGPDTYSSTVDSTLIGSTTTIGGSKKISFTFQIPSQYFAWGLELYINIPQGLQAGQTIAFGNVQLEEGSVATSFENRPIGLEFSLCQRYYEVGNVKFYIPNSGASSTFTTVQYSVGKRTIPSLTFSSAGIIGGYNPPSSIETSYTSGFIGIKVGEEQNYRFIASAEL